MTATDHLRFEIDDDIGYVTFDRRAVRNALTFDMYERLAEICREVDADRRIKALVMTGAGDKAFTSGTDISEFTFVATQRDALDYAMRVNRVVDAVERCRVPTIAAIAGACFDAGLILASVCDFRIAAPNARFGLRIARTLGACMSHDNVARLAALIGPARVKDLVFRARAVEAPEAFAIGLLTEVTIDVGGLLPRAESIAHLVATHAPLTLQATKVALRRLRTRPQDDDRDLILRCYTSRDFREGVEAFLSKRLPQWRGE